MHEHSFKGKSMTDEAPIRIFRLMGKYGLPVLIHADLEFSQEMETVLELCPRTSFIWAHIAYNFCSSFGGSCRSVDEVKAFLDGYSNLYFDISHWKISPIYLCEVPWQDLLNQYSKRFLFGTDMSENYLMESVWLPSYKLILSGLDVEARYNIEERNIRSLIL